MVTGDGTGPQTLLVPRPLQSQDPAVPRPLQSPDPRSPQTLAVSRPLQSPDLHGPRTLTVPRPSQSPDHRSPQTLAVLRPTQSPDPCSPQTLTVPGPSQSPDPCSPQTLTLSPQTLIVSSTYRHIVLCTWLEAFSGTSVNCSYVRAIPCGLDFCLATGDAWGGAGVNGTCVSTCITVTTEVAC